MTFYITYLNLFNVHVQYYYFCEIIKQNFLINNDRLILQLRFNSKHTYNIFVLACNFFIVTKQSDLCNSDILQPVWLSEYFEIGR